MIGYKRKFKISKKGDMTVSTLIKIILALVVLVVMSFIIYNYALKGNKNMDTTQNSAIDQLTSGKCEVLGMPRKCCDTNPDYTEIIKLSTGVAKQFDDCSSCCERKN